jgi:hypothetical protein
VSRATTQATNPLLNQALPDLRAIQSSCRFAVSHKYTVYYEHTSLHEAGPNSQRFLHRGDSLPTPEAMLTDSPPVKRTPYSN